MTLRQLRLSNIDADAHNHTWNENRGIPSHKFAVGDYGYIPDGKKDFDDFIVLGNVAKKELAKFAISHHAYGTHWCQEASIPWDAPMKPFPQVLPGDVTCWALVVPPYAEVGCQIIHSSSFGHVADAWRLLLLHGRDLAMEHDIKPEKLMLITQAGTNQDFYIHDFDTRPPGPPRGLSHPVHQPFDFYQPGFSGFNDSGHMFSSFPDKTAPAIMYLITSPTPGFDPYWSHTPIPVPQGTTRPGLNHGWTYRIGWSTGFIHWIQLHSEDFAE
ncbi:hypothetical protein C0995_008867 [Termitomyces sp. Mi166|nr:hypothetical protein C0995_008867 [Termitomyces sp. Mi166\